MPKTVSMIREELAHREAIRDCLMRYSRGIDRCDEELLRSVYWPEATDEHVEFMGTGYEFIADALPKLRAMDQTMHLLGNILIDVQGISAFVETYFQAFHRLPGEAEAHSDLVVGGRYVDRMELRQDEWRIARRVVVIDWFRNYADSADWRNGFLGMKVEAGSRKPQDRSYNLLRSSP